MNACARESRGEEGACLTAGPAKKVTIYVGEDHKYHGQSAIRGDSRFSVLSRRFGRNVVRGIAGFGADHHMHTDRIESLTANLPINIEFIESPEKVEELLPKLHEMAGTGLIEVQDTTVVKPSEAATAESLAAISARSEARRQSQADAHLHRRK